MTLDFSVKLPTNNMNIEKLKAHYEEHCRNKEAQRVLMEQHRLNMLASDGAMQGLAILIAEEEKALEKREPEKASRTDGKTKNQKPQ